MRRALAAVGLVAVALLAAPHAGAQDGYAGGWIDPAPSATRDGKPLAYLDTARMLTGQVSHPNGIQSVSVVLVPDPDDPPADGCDAEMDPNIAMEQNGTTATFRVNATFPCNLLYELRATAQANADTGITGGTPAPYSMPLVLGVAIPPAPVASVDAILEVDGDDRSVTLEWPKGSEPDLLGYVITRTVGDDTETLGQVDVGERRTFTDDEPPVGESSRYDVVAVRNGPDDEVEQVASVPTSVMVDVPGDGEEEPGDADAGGEPVDPQLAGEATPNDGGAPPDPGALSSVRRVRGTGPASPPTTADTGYSETIDYGEVGDAAAVPPGDNAVVALYDESTAGSPWSDKETMTFVAGGLAVLSGAGTILTVTRRAARAAY
jgi:hypothetical protein